MREGDLAEGILEVPFYDEGACAVVADKLEDILKQGIFDRRGFGRDKAVNTRIR